ncbi:uncharacterized protein LOC119565433 [Chelonia mydas]|uniref:uncharacterized protein LOC119565433 n=1 Tax=Chelonia mydas TaxID=8469 RepID=UPI0018A1BD67|nr:uncharacterized protein LOC119565433 [Chelonia mydas]
MPKFFFSFFFPPSLPLPSETLISAAIFKRLFKILIKECFGVPQEFYHHLVTLYVVIQHASWAARFYRISLSLDSTKKQGSFSNGSSTASSKQLVCGMLYGCPRSSSSTAVQTGACGQLAPSSVFLVNHLLTFQFISVHALKRNIPRLEQMSEGRCPDIRSYNYIPNCFWIHLCEETAQKPAHPDPVFPNDPKQETKEKKAVPKTHKKAESHV